MNGQIVGHDWAVALLRQALARGRTAHAYLLTGPPQIGKTKLGWSLAQALNCTGATPPCGSCPSCVKTLRRVHPDIHLVESQDNGRTIKIDQIRTLRREAFLAPYEARYRVFILRRADRASTEAANSLLKILEEPPAHVVLILTAVSADALPSTVISRCQRLDLRPAAQQIVKNALLARGVDADTAQLLARLSGGRVGWAFDAIEHESTMEQRARDLDALYRVLSADCVQRFSFAQQTGRDSAGARRLLEVWMLWWRDLLLVCSQTETHVLNVDRIHELRALAAQSNTTQAWQGLSALQETAAQLEDNVNTRLALEGLMLHLPRWQMTDGQPV
ncbi:MAG: DNA polymerase III subunit delta' [Anaerolineae bacterium]